MDRQRLKNLTLEYFECYDYRSKETGNPNCFIFERRSALGKMERMLVYFHEKGEEDLLENTLSSINKKWSDVKERFFLSPEPLAGEPLSVIKKCEFTYQVPVYFFDKEFSAAKNSTPLKNLENEIKKLLKERIEQPCKFNEERIRDLLYHLEKELENPNKPCLRIIIAPAGYGKTVLMASLYNSLKNKFEQSKKKQKLSAKPLIMLPGHIKKAQDLDGLINNFIGDEYDFGVANKEVFKFWVKHNFVVWLLDGLEELISVSKDNSDIITTILEDYITAPGSDNPQIIIAIRKSLLFSSPELKEKIEEWKDILEIYELDEWDMEQQKKYFEKNLKLDENEKKNFMVDLENSQVLKQICKIPYYCSLVLDLKSNNQFGAYFNNELEFIKYAVEKLCEREFKKGLDKDYCPVEEVQKELFKELASASLRQQSITKDLLEEYAKDLIAMYLGKDENEFSKEEKEVVEGQVKYLMRHALLTQIKEDIDFVHELIKEYFQALVLVSELEHERLDLFGGKEIERDSITFKYLLENSHNVKWSNIMEKIFKSYSPLIFRNIMSIFLSSDDKILKQNSHLLSTYQLTNRDLTGLVFKNLDLNDMDFTHSNLTNVEFYSCDLRKAKLNHCLIRGTFFDSKCNLEGLSINGANLESIRTEKGLIEDLNEIKKYFYNRTGISPYEGPCQATLNLRKLLEKVVRKGYKPIPRKFLLQTKCPGGANASDILDACIRYGILSEKGGDEVMCRPGVSNEIKEFVKDTKKVSEKILKVLDDICRDKDKNCRHI
jgi:hypothetical protein